MRYYLLFLLVLIVTACGPKPDPEALEQILAHFGYTVDEAVYIGDSMVDREHTEALGMRLIAFKNQTLPAEYHVRSFMEITRLPIFGEIEKGGQ